MTNPPRVTAWNEYRHEKTNAAVAEIYPDDIHQAIARHLRDEGLTVQTATLDEPEHGLTGGVLAQTDVLIWADAVFIEVGEKSFTFDPVTKPIPSSINPKYYVSSLTLFTGPLRQMAPRSNSGIFPSHYPKFLGLLIWDGYPILF